MASGDIMYFLKGKGLSRKALRGSLTYFDILTGLTALALASACLVLTNSPGWVWSNKDSLGVGLFLGTTLAFILLRRRVSAHTMPWLRVCIAALMVAAGVVLFRRWDSMWVGAGVTMLLFMLCLRSKTVSEGLERRDIYRVLLVVGSLPFAAILAEGTLRLVPDLLPEGARARLDWQAAVDDPWHVAHSYIGHLHSIEYLRRIKASTGAKTARFWKEPAGFDAWGFRNTEPWPERVDLLIVGDSLTYSLTVNDAQAWPVLLERALAPRRVLNLGLVGAAPQQYLRVYETFGAQLSPKVLLVGLFLGNDLTDALAFDVWWSTERQKDFMDFLLRKGRTEVNGWLQKSYFYTLLNDLRASYQSGPALQGKTVRLPDGSRVQLVPRLLARQAPFSSSGQPAFALVLHTIEHLCTLATQQQTHCLVLIFPDKEGVYLPVFGAAAANLAAPFLAEAGEARHCLSRFRPAFPAASRGGRGLVLGSGCPSERAGVCGNR